MRERSAWTIRRAGADDIAAITAMYQADGFRHAQGDPERAAFYFAAVRAAGGEVLIAVEGGQVVGHLELLHCLEAPPLGRYGAIETLEVRSDRRRRGIGRALVEAALALMRATGAERVEVVAEDERSAALYTSTGFRAGTRFLDLDLMVSAEALAAAALGPPLPPGRRPWLELRHVAGRQYPAAYCWARAYLAGAWGLPEAEGSGAWQLRGGGAVVLADPWIVHLFLPPDLPPDSAAAWPAWLAAFGLRAHERECHVHTIVEAGLAARLGLAQRWPGGASDAFTLLACRLT